MFSGICIASFLAEFEDKSFVVKIVDIGQKVEVAMSEGKLNLKTFSIGL